MDPNAADHYNSYTSVVSSSSRISLALQVSGPESKIETRDLETWALALELLEQDERIHAYYDTIMLLYHTGFEEPPKAARTRQLVYQVP